MTPDTITAFTELVKALNENLNQLIAPLGILFGILTVIFGMAAMFVKGLIRKYREVAEGSVTAIEISDATGAKKIMAQTDLSKGGQRVLEKIIAKAEQKSNASLGVIEMEKKP